MLNEFFIKGWEIFEEPNLELNTDISEYLISKYLFLFPNVELIEFSENFTVAESDRIVEWHNDSKFGMNITFLYYANDMSPETGGSISIKNVDTLDEIKIYPKAGTLILMSQAPNILHKAEYCSITRHMFNIDFYVDGL